MSGGGFGIGGTMNDATGPSAAHPAALKVIFALAGVFALVLLGARLVPLFAFVQALLVGAPLVLVEPGVFGGCIIAAAIVIAPLVLWLPRPRRVTALVVLAGLTLLAFVLAGNLTARGGPNTDHTPVATLLHARGYVRCAAADQVRGSGRATRGEFVAAGWAIPGACPDQPAAAIGVTDGTRP